MKLTNQQLINVQQGIVHLDGVKVPKMVGDEQREHFTSYKITSKGRFTFAKVLHVIDGALAPYRKARESIIKSHTDGTGICGEDHPKFGTVTLEINELLAQEVEVSIDQVDPDVLQLEENERLGNEIPTTVLHALMPILK